MKYVKKYQIAGFWRRSPCGERGLKFPFCNQILLLGLVAPRAGSVD